MEHGGYPFTFPVRGYLQANGGPREWWMRGRDGEVMFAQNKFRAVLLLEIFSKNLHLFEYITYLKG